MVNKNLKIDLLYIIGPPVIGTLYALYYQEFSFSILLVFLFIFLTYLSRKAIHILPHHHMKKTLFVSEGLLLMIALYFGVTYSWYMLLILLMTSFLLQIKHLFVQYKMSIFYNIMAVFLSFGILSILSFYSHTRFISEVVVYGQIPFLTLGASLLRTKK